MRTYPVVGAFYRPPAQAILDALAIGTALFLVPEDDNIHDANAIAIWISKDCLPAWTDSLAGPMAGFGVTREKYAEFSDVHLGYLPRQVAAAMRSRGFKEMMPGTFSVAANGKPQVRVEFDMENGA